jgi:hypothetical protein
VYQQHTSTAALEIEGLRLGELKSFRPLSASRKPDARATDALLEITTFNPAKRPPRRVRR